MAVPQISALPTPPSRAESPSTFTQRADALLSALPAFVSQANDQAGFVDGRATLADQKASAASSSAAAAAASQSAAAASETAAAQSRDSALQSASAAKASASAAAADRAAVNQAVTDANQFSPAYFGTHADAKAAVLQLKVGTPIVIGADERYGGRRTNNRANAAGAESLVLDFANGVYQSEDLVQFVSYVQMQVLPVPASSTAFGFFGAFAVDANYLYVATGDNTWKRVALGAF